MTQRHPRPIALLWLLAAAVGLPANGAEDKSIEIYTSAKGSYRLESSNDKPEVFVLMKSSGQREPLLDATLEDPDECLVIYSGSPDENWIFRDEHWRHHGVRNRQLYHHEDGAKFVYFKGKEWFTRAAEAYAIKVGGFKKTDFYERRGPNITEDHFSANFCDWSPDSSRLLLSIAGEGDYRDPRPGPCYVYFNTRTKTFELTPYLRALNKLKGGQNNNETSPACAEPMDPLPAEEELKARFEKVDQQLKEFFAHRKAHLKERETAEYWQETERDWIKTRDEGLKLYLQFASEKDRETRRLQFLGDTTAVKLAWFEAGGS
jgi:uncharacterized protein YecT (DUF1311 family)